MVVLTIGATNQSTKIRAGSLNVKLNTLDVVLKAPVVRPVEGDVVTLDSPAWSGVVTSVETSDPVERVGVPLMVTVSATNENDALASAAPFGLSDAAVQQGNLLSADQASLETGVSGWAPLSNCTIAQTAAQALVGTKSMQVTSIATSDMYPTTPQGLAGFPVAPGLTYTARAAYRAAVTGRSVATYLRWFDSAGVMITQINGSAVDTAVGWTVASVTGVAPANAVYACVIPLITTGGAGEVHYVDAIGLGIGTSTAFIAGGTTPTFKYTGLKVKNQRNSDGTLTVQGSCRIQTSGLWPAMTFLLTSSNHGIAAGNYSVRNVSVSWPTNRDHPVFAVDFGDPIVTMTVWLNSNPGPILPITTTKITDGAVTTPKVNAGAITADKLEAVLILATLLRAGAGSQHVEIDQNGVRAYDTAGNLVVNIPADGSPVYINAQLVATTLAVTGNAVFQGAMNEFALASVTQLDGSQGNPTQKPTLAQSWDSMTLPRIGAVDGVTITRWGLDYDAAGGAGGATKVFWQMAYSDVNSHWYVVELLATDLSLNRYMDFGTATTVYDCCRMGLYLYVLFHIASGWRVYRYVAATLALDATYVLDPPITPPNFPSICSDGSSMWVLDSVVGGAISFSQYSSIMAKIATIATGYTPPTKPSNCAAGNFDFGAFRIISSDHGGATHLFDIAGARQVNEEFNFPGSSWDTGITYGDADGTGARFWTHAFQTTTITKHSNWTWTTASSVYWVAYTWYDSNATGGTHETQVSPRGSITMGRRKKLTITAQPIPGAGGVDDPNNLRFYMLPNATDPGVAGLKLQATQAAVTYVASSYASGGAADPATNTFVAGTPAEFKSQTGGVSIKGDGTTTFGAGLKATVYRARGYRNAALSLTSNSVFLVVAFDSETYDPNNNFDVATGKYTVPVTGLYHLDARIAVTAGARSILSAFVNAAETVRGTDNATAGQVRDHTVSADLLLTAGDVVDIRWDDLENVARALDVGTGVCYFDIRFIGT